MDVLAYKTMAGLRGGSLREKVQCTVGDEHGSGRPLRSDVLRVMGYLSGSGMVGADVPPSSVDRGAVSGFGEQVASGVAIHNEHDNGDQEEGDGAVGTGGLDRTELSSDDGLTLEGLHLSEGAFNPQVPGPAQLDGRYGSMTQQA